MLIVTAWVSETEARRLMRQGVAGIFLKQVALQRTAGGHPPGRHGRHLVRPLLLRNRRRHQWSASSRRPVFNERQRKVLRFVLEGLSNKEIAWRLQISESYVKAILQSLFQKTGVRTRGQLVRVAFEQYEDQI